MGTLQRVLGRSRESTQTILSLHGDALLYRALKRLLDLTVAGVILVLGAPLWLLITLAIKVYSPGPALYVEKREIGQGGRPFHYFKFRSMHVGRDEGLHREAFRRYYEGQPLGMVGDGKGGQRPVFKLVNDPRIHGLGRWLRKTGLDEIPQLINVLKGDMSLVGPRPAIWYEWEMYQAQYADRLAVRPGITGYYQVYGRADVGFQDMYRMDRHYIEHRSLWLDLKIMLLTPWVMLTGKGAH
jgi:lipopolysaccharide/colanic/teichoic acid biosynthesis glycosyltransferase